MEQDLKEVKTEFTDLFQQMKKSFTLAINNLEQDFDNQELAQTFAPTVTTNQVNQLVDQKLASAHRGSSLNYDKVALRVKTIMGDGSNTVFERDI